ncbi:spore germination protein Q [Virgibacillus natechei]|uniref:Spore germination protein Q n=1 Tax=Virgibacillus natechei TaxID=1216297 RepID=A0ABS4IFV0_9BACI|nr:spore coat protein GerQ [Virgibacillus natechei]MBP1969820.1 spore germination protein Q [Virgibacillus natechei]UZD12648.1 spore coat protein GerQ [Virgibacillus natechei]
MSDNQENTNNPNQQYPNPYQPYPYYYYPQASPAYYPAYYARQEAAQQQQQLQQQQQAQAQQAPANGVEGMLPLEQSYIENILRLNRGKRVSVYMTFEENEQWNAQIFKGVIEAAGRDHIIISDPQTGKRYLLLMVYLDYVVFEDEIEYEYPLAAGSGQFTNQPPR